MLQDRTGNRVPQVSFRTRRDPEWEDLTTDDIFAGKTVVVFPLHGAFTPTCSWSHVPRYDKLVAAFKNQGVTEVVYVSVNDAFVMNEWRKAQNANSIPFPPDGNAMPLT